MQESLVFSRYSYRYVYLYDGSFPVPAACAARDCTGIANHGRAVYAARVCPAVWNWRGRASGRAWWLGHQVSCPHSRLRSPVHRANYIFTGERIHARGNLARNPIKNRQGKVCHLVIFMIISSNCLVFFCPWVRRAPSTSSRLNNWFLYYILYRCTINVRRKVKQDSCADGTTRFFRLTACENYLFLCCNFALIMFNVGGY